MTEHIPTSQLKRFCVRALAVDDLVAVGKHVAGCSTCHSLFAETLRTLREPSSLRLTLGREFWIQHEHVDFEQLVEIADGRLDATDREILDIHLKTCATCKEDVRSFLACRDELGKDGASASPQPLRTRRFVWTRWNVRAWPPAYAAAVAIIAIAIVAAVIVTKRRAGTLEAVRTPIQNSNSLTVRTPTPDSLSAGSNPAPPAPVPSNVPPIPNPSPTLTVKNRTPVSPPKISGADALFDYGGRTVTIDETGTVSGLNDIETATRDEVAKALTTKQIDVPEISTKLAGPDITLRGSNRGQHFMLRSPARTVVISDRPLFEWDKLPGASSYRVYVGDLKGHEVAKSEALRPGQTTWKPAAPLNRGESYSWAVEAVVDGKEVLAPGAAAPEMKFHVLSAGALQQLYQLKRTRSHLVLGIFYVKVGLLTEAERELRQLVHLNPNDEIPKKLLRSVQLMRSTAR